MPPLKKNAFPLNYKIDEKSINLDLGGKQFLNNFNGKHTSILLKLIN